MKYQIFILLFIFVELQLIGQGDIDSSYIYSPPKQNSDTLGQLKVTQSTAIASLIRKKIIINKARPLQKGYRIQILSSSGSHSRDKSNKVMAEFKMEFDSIATYLVYQSPYFKVRIGDFRTKMEAFYFLQIIKKKYPQAFIVADKVNIPKLETLNKELNYSPN